MTAVAPGHLGCRRRLVICRASTNISRSALSTRAQQAQKPSIFRRVCDPGVARESCRWLGLLRGSRFGWLAENPAAAFAEVGALPAHTGRDPFHVGNFR